MPPGSAAPSLPSLSGPESHEDLGTPFSAGSLRAQPRPPASPAEPFNPVKIFGGPPVSLEAKAPPATPRPTPVPHTPRAATAPVEFNFGNVVNDTQLVLHALFMSDQDLTPHEIVDLCSQLPGIRSSLAIIAGNVISSGHGSGSEEVRHFTANAARSHESLTSLAESMNISGDGSFTLRSGTSVRTFFIERGVCLAVLHETPAFAPGVRDKLILTARSLADLAD
jgi:hypothetical protein